MTAGLQQMTVSPHRAATCKPFQGLPYGFSLLDIFIFCYTTFRLLMASHIPMVVSLSDGSFGLPSQCHGQPWPIPFFISDFLCLPCFVSGPTVSLPAPHGVLSAHLLWYCPSVNSRVKDCCRFWLTAVRRVNSSETNGLNQSYLCLQSWPSCSPSSYSLRVNVLSFPSATKPIRCPGLWSAT